MILAMGHGVTWADNDDTNTELINFTSRIKKVF